jgi:F-type H+-transporting ATPase subunit alpha
MDDTPLEAVNAFEKGLLDYMNSSKADLVGMLKEKKALDKDIEGRLQAAIEDFKKGFKA